MTRASGERNVTLRRPAYEEAPTTKGPIMKHAALAVLGAAALHGAAFANPQPAEAEPAAEAAPALFPDYDALVSLEDMSAEEAEQTRATIAELEAFNASLEPQTGTIALPGGGADLHLSEGFYFLGVRDARRVLEQQWDNAEDTSILGMIFPAGTDSAINDYAVAITFDAVGYVSDEDAASLDADALMRDMKKGQAAANAELETLGLPTADLLGWAKAPDYDAERHRVTWGKRLQFSGTDVETLNFNQRFLGRRGVLDFNYIATTDVLPSVLEASETLGEVVAYRPTFRYADFDPATDKVATYGLAGLVAGGAIAKKTGLLAVLLLFLKKGWVFILAGIGGLWRLLSRRSHKDAPLA